MHLVRVAIGNVIVFTLLLHQEEDGRAGRQGGAGQIRGWKVGLIGTSMAGPRGAPGLCLNGLHIYREHISHSMARRVTSPESICIR